MVSDKNKIYIVEVEELAVAVACSDEMCKPWFFSRMHELLAIARAGDDDVYDALICLNFLTKIRAGPTVFPVRKSDPDLPSLERLLRKTASVYRKPAAWIFGRWSRDFSTTENPETASEPLACFQSTRSSVGVLRDSFTDNPKPVDIPIGLPLPGARVWMPDDFLYYPRIPGADPLVKRVVLPQRYWYAWNGDLGFWSTQLGDRNTVDGVLSVLCQEPPEKVVHDSGTRAWHFDIGTEAIRWAQAFALSNSMSKSVDSECFRKNTLKVCSQWQSLSVPIDDPIMQMNHAVVCAAEAIVLRPCANVSSTIDAVGDAVRLAIQWRERYAPSIIRETIIKRVDDQLGQRIVAESHARRDGERTKAGEWAGEAAAGGRRDPKHLPTTRADGKTPLTWEQAEKALEAYIKSGRYGTYEQIASAIGSSSARVSDILNGKAETSKADAIAGRQDLKDKLAANQLLAATRGQGGGRKADRRFNGYVEHATAARVLDPSAQAEANEATSEARMSAAAKRLDELQEKYRAYKKQVLIDEFARVRGKPFKPNERSLLEEAHITEDYLREQLIGIIIDQEFPNAGTS